MRGELMGVREARQEEVDAAIRKTSNGTKESGGATQCTLPCICYA